jgi:signal transduction histidine kinase/ActR/RegA family two-component response regulator/HPt (histidine-containing phosphotransfer) domain-containing protein
MTPRWNVSRWARRQWAAAIGAVVLVTLAPLGWIQWQQVQMLQDVSRNQVDSIMWQAYQLERELDRLTQSLQGFATNSPEADGADLVERYEVFYSRIQLLTDMPRKDLLAHTAAYIQAVDQLKAFTALADPVFEQPDNIRARPEALEPLLAQAVGLKPALLDLTREANRSVARFVDERNLQLRDQSVLVTVLSILQAAMMVMLVALLVRHVRRQRRENRKLVELSHELEQARDQAEAANHGKSVFLANMSHEIRTPFQGLMGMLNLLDEPQLNAKQRDYLHTARDSAMHLLGVLNDILDVSTMESGTLKLSPAPTHLQDVVHEVENLMQVSARDKGLTLLVSAANDLPEWVVADATRLRQIMFNLTSNAIKFTSVGSVIVEVKRQRDSTDGIVIRVRDSGMGMDEETVQNLFTRFYQADNSLRRRAGGTGLGLEISRNLARMMDGDIAVQSKPGIGSIFTVTVRLPACAAPRNTGLVLVGDSPHHRRLKMLVAEDHPINLKYMSILLERMGHDAVFCENGQEALELMKRQAFDVVLLDYHMPVLDGLATTQAIRAMKGRAAGTKVILVTADVVNDTRKRAIEVGVDEFTSKPLQATDLQLALLHCGLLESDTMPADLGIVQAFRHTTPFPLSASEMPVRVSEERTQEATIDFESYNEIASLMPEDTLADLMGTLFDAPDGSIPVLLADLERGDIATIGYSAHKLKGTAMLLGFKDIVRTSSLIEGLAQKGQQPDARILGPQLQRDSEATQRALRRHRPRKTA